MKRYRHRLRQIKNWTKGCYGWSGLFVCKLPFDKTDWGVFKGFAAIERNMLCGSFDTRKEAEDALIDYMRREYSTLHKRLNSVHGFLDRRPTK